MKIKKVAAVVLAMIMLMGMTTSVYASTKIESVSIDVSYGTLYEGDDESDITVTVPSGVNYTVGGVEAKNMSSNGWKEGDIPRIKIELQANSGYIFSGAAAVPSGVDVSGAEAVTASRADGNEILYITVELDEVEHDDDQWEEDDDENNTPGSTGPGNGTPGHNTTDGVWLKDDIGWWYLNQDRTYTKYNWQMINSKWYFFDERGYMLASQWLNWKNSWYYLGPDGDMWTDRRTPDGYYVDYNGVWIQGR